MAKRYAITRDEHGGIQVECDGRSVLPEGEEFESLREAEKYVATAEQRDEIEADIARVESEIDAARRRIDRARTVDAKAAIWDEIDELETELSTIRRSK